MTTTTLGRYLTFAQLRERGIGYSRAHIRRLWYRGKFPRPMKLSDRRLVWREDDVRAWLAERAAEAEAAPGRNWAA